MIFREDAVNPVNRNVKYPFSGEKSHQQRNWDISLKRETTMKHLQKFHNFPCNSILFLLKITIIVCKVKKPNSFLNKLLFFGNF